MRKPDCALGVVRPFVETDRLKASNLYDQTPKLKHTH